MLIQINKYDKMLGICSKYIIIAWLSMQTRYTKPELATQERASPWEVNWQQERIHTMGDKGGKKDKNKIQKQKIKKHEQEAKKKQDQQQPKNP